MGQPPYVTTEKDRGRVEGLAAAGMSHERIAELMRIDTLTLAQHYKRELALAKEIADATVVQTLYTMATGAGVWQDAVPAATIFWVKARLRWRTVDQVELGGPGDFERMTDAELRDMIRKELGGPDKAA